MVHRERDLRVRTDRRPLTLQVADALMEYVRESDLGPGDTLPSEPELAQIFGVGRSTIREALTDLESDGILRRRQGLGTTLTGLARMHQVGLEILEPMEARARRFGWDVHPDDVRVETVTADPATAEQLGLLPGDDVVRITRTLRSGDGPLSVIRSHVAHRAQEAIDAAHDGRLAADLFAPTNAAYARAALFPDVAEGDVAARLELPEGALVLRMEQLIVGADDRPRDWSVQWIAADRLRVEVVRRPARRATTTEPSADPRRPKGS